MQTEACVDITVYPPGVVPPEEVAPFPWKQMLVAGGIVGVVGIAIWGMLQSKE
jgi:hypothetical protein